MSKEMREQINKVKNFGEFLNEETKPRKLTKYEQQLLNDKQKLRDKYSNVVFKNKERFEDGMKLELFKRLETFIDFYNKYNPINYHFYNGVDTYLESKKQYDGIVNGKLFIDVEMMKPESYIRNNIKMLGLDEPELKKRENF